MKIHNYLKVIFIPVTAIAFFFAIYVPMVAYVNNSQEFLQVRPWLLFGASLCVFSMLWILLVILFLLLKNASLLSRYTLAVLCGLTLAFYVQGNLINLNYGVLDGREIPWDKMVGAGIINTIVWVIILAGFISFAFLAKKNFFGLLKTVMFCFLAYTVLILGMRCLTLKNDKVYPLQFTYEDFNRLSSNSNVIILILDSFDQKLFDELIEQKPYYKEKLKEFTYYKNTIGKFPYTHFALPQIITGISDENCCSYGEYKDNAYLSSQIFKIAEKYNYSVDIYANNEYAPSNRIKHKYKGVFNNVFEENIGRQYLCNCFINVYNSSLFSYLPHFIKKYHSYLMVSMNNKKDLINFVKNSTEVESELFKIIENGSFSLTNVNKIKFYHMVGVHLPYFNISKAEKCINSIVKFVEILKNKGVYDKCNIFVLADHGQLDRAKPLLLCNNSGGKFKISDIPFSYDHLGGAYVSAIEKNRINITAKKSRLYFYNQRYDEMGKRILNLENAKSIYFGNNLTVLETEGIECENIGNNFWFWTNGEMSQIKIPLVKKNYNKNLGVKLTCSALVSEKYPFRRFKFYVNGVIIAEKEFSPSCKKQEIVLQLPAKSNHEPYLQLKIEAENPIKAIEVLPKCGDHRLLGLNINRIEIFDLKYDVPDMINFSKILQSDSVMLEGFANPEPPYGCWNNGFKSVIKTILPEDLKGENIEVTFSCHAFLAGGKIPKQRMKVSSAGKVLIERSFSKEGVESFKVRLPAEVTKKSQVTLDFEFPDCASPKELGMSEDPRKLAVFFRTCEIKAVDDK